MDELRNRRERRTGAVDRDAYREVCASIQQGMDALARRRRLPLFG